MNLEEQQALEVTQMNTETEKEPETDKVCHTAIKCQQPESLK